MQKTCIIIPCFNEGERLEIKSFSEFLQNDHCDLCFVNDGSTDNTLALLNSLKKKFPTRISITDLPNNQGKASAVRQGVLTTLNTGSYHFIGFLDADLATPLKEINLLLSYFAQGFTVVIGSRVKRLGTNINRSMGRHYLGRIFATYASYLLGIKVYDSQCGAKIFEKDIAHVLFNTPFVSKWLFDLELIQRLKKHDPTNFNQNIIEVPLREWQEKKNSKINFQDFLFVPLDVIKIKKLNNKNQ